jgi:hypothetical protein
MTSLQKKSYPFISLTHNTIERIKRNKIKYNTLKQYQDILINEITGKYHNESITKLNKTFFELLQQCYVKHRIDKEHDNDITHRSFIKNIENKEEKIIKNMNELNKGIYKKMKRNRKYLFRGNGKVFHVNGVFRLFTFDKVVK